MSAAGCFGVHAEVLDPRRPLLGVEVDPDAVHLDVAAGVALHRPPPAGRDRRHAAAPGRQLDLGVAGERLEHVEQDAAHEPQVLRQPPARLLDVVDGDVLEEASHRVEPQPAVRVHVGEADAPASRNVRPRVGTGIRVSSTDRTLRLSGGLGLRDTFEPAPPTRASALILRDMARCTNCGQTNPEGSQFCNSCGARLAAIPPSTGEARKVVTVVFADVVGSTSLVERLEPESARRVLDRYFEVMHAIVERHGGTVEKYIGDALMAVFGIPTLHEDDALRAVRAAGEMRDALTALNDELGGSFGVTVDMRIGVATGEVVARDPALGQAFVTGDAVNVAARLETTAEPGDILVDEPTFHRIRAAVGAQPLGRVAVKGKAEPIQVHRLLVVDASSARRLDSPFVGRVTELALLSETLADVVGERTTRLVTVIGEAGVGKSRLVEEFLRERPEGWQ